MHNTLCWSPGLLATVADRRYRVPWKPRPAGQDSNRVTARRSLALPSKPLVLRCEGAIGVGGERDGVAGSGRCGAAATATATAATGAATTAATASGRGGALRPRNGLATHQIRNGAARARNGNRHCDFLVQEGLHDKGAVVVREQANLTRGVPGSFHLGF